ncbi:MAG: AAA-like domain-containing protein, partial [Dysgonamonadaceae bacterium]|nr:AAA-like domain-containing protein [Dysgonamonadaceae bacterium]
MKYFNIAGPCNNVKHYMIDAATRLHGVEALIDNEQYFVIHAARQSGKTTYLQDLAGRLDAEGKYYVLYCSLEGVQDVVEPERGIPAILDCIFLALQKSAIPFIYDESYDREKKSKPLVILALFLMNLVKSLDKPLVIFFDEADCLSEGTLISFLRQLRNGYNDRSIAPFVHSVALVGMRNIRDFKARIRPESETLGSASPFNIATESLTLKNFTKEEIAELYRQHTGETGQLFEEDAIELVWEQTQGQPWLVNAVAREVIDKILQSDYTKPVTAELVDQAIQNIILRRDTHIDSLLERLKEERVRKVIEPIIIGEIFIDRLSDDFLYVRDLGLITETSERLGPSNPIYGEVIARTLSYNLQQNLQQYHKEYQLPRYLKDGRIDMDYLMRDFQQFWRENSDIWKDKFDYKEAAPHIILMGFLQRVVNGGGQIIRDMAAGAGR